MKTLLPESGGGLVLFLLLVLSIIVIGMLFAARKKYQSRTLHAEHVHYTVPTNLTPFELALYASKKYISEGMLGEMFELIRKRVLALKPQPITHQIVYYNIHVLPDWEKQ